MSKVWVAAIFGVGGVVTGLLIAKYYARHEVQGTVHSLLDRVGLAGGTVEEIADAIIVPQIG